MDIDLDDLTLKELKTLMVGWIAPSTVSRSGRNKRRWKR